MIGQMQMLPDGTVSDKVDLAIRRLKAFEPPEGYYVAFSGGKDWPESSLMPTTT